MTKTEFSDKIYGYLHNMKIGQVVEIDMLPGDIIPSPIAKAFFIDVVKDYIRHDNGRHNGYYISFNNDYSKIQKLKYYRFADWWSF